MKLKIRKKIDNAFEKLALFIYDNPYKVLITIGLMLVLLLPQLRHTTFDSSAESFLHKDDPAMEIYNEFRDQFGREEMIILAIKPEKVFDFAFLTKLRKLHIRLEAEVPYLKEVNSLINASKTIGEKDTLIVEDLFENWPETDEELKAIEQFAMNNQFYKNTVLSEKGDFTVIAIQTVSKVIDNSLDNNATSTQQVDDIMAGFDDAEQDDNDIEKSDTQISSDAVWITDAQNSEVINAVLTIIKDFNSQDFPIAQTGTPLLTDLLKRAMIRDMQKFMVLLILTISLMLGFLFRKISGIVLPMMTVILSLLSTVALMSLFRIPLSTITQIMPSFLLSVGTGYGIHILALFYYQLNQGLTKKEAIIYTLGHSGLPILLTALTTAGGLLSFSSAKVAPIATLGVFGSIGVLIALFLSLTFIPALLSIFPIKANLKKGQDSPGRFDSFLIGLAKFSTKNAVVIIIISSLFIIGALIVIPQIRFSHNPMNWFPKNHELPKATKLINDNLKGSTTLEVIINTGKENGLYNPEVLNRLEKIGKELENYHKGDIFVGKTISLNDILKETHKALNENKPEFYAIPQNADLAAQEIFLFENNGGDDMDSLVDRQFSKVRMTIKLPWVDSIKYQSFITEAESMFKKEFDGYANIQITGISAILGRTFTAALVSMKISYGIAFIVISILMILLLGSIKRGLISMIPNLFPIIITIALMFVFDMPLDLFTMLIGSIAIGLAVDDTIHFMHNFKSYYEETGDPVKAVTKTFLTAGRAMILTSAILCAGFFVFTQASMQNLINFGILTGAAIFFALIADVLLSPAIMVLITKKK